MADFTINGDITTETLCLCSPNVPTTPTSAGVAGDIGWDEDYMYICVAANTWKRTVISIEWA